MAITQPTGEVVVVVEVASGVWAVTKVELARARAKAMQIERRVIIFVMLGC